MSHSGVLQKAKKQSRRLARISSELASQVRADLTYRRYQTQSERQALRATQEFSRQAAELQRVIENSRPALRRAKNQFPQVRMAMRQAKRALQQVVTSYSVSEKIQKAQQVTRNLAETLNAPVRPGQGGNGGNHFGFN